MNWFLCLPFFKPFYLAESFFSSHSWASLFASEIFNPFLSLPINFLPCNIGLDSFFLEQKYSLNINNSKVYFTQIYETTASSLFPQPFKLPGKKMRGLWLREVSEVREEGLRSGIDMDGPVKLYCATNKHPVWQTRRLSWPLLSETTIENFST